MKLDEKKKMKGRCHTLNGNIFYDITAIDRIIAAAAEDSKEVKKRLEKGYGQQGTICRLKTEILRTMDRPDGVPYELGVQFRDPEDVFWYIKASLGIYTVKYGGKEQYVYVMPQAVKLVCSTKDALIYVLEQGEAELEHLHSVNVGDEIPEIC